MKYPLLNSFDSYALLTIVKFKLKLGYLKMELKLEKRCQMKCANSKVLIFKDSRTCWTKHGKGLGSFLVFIKAIFDPYGSCQVPSKHNSNK
jgi:hypothetical protein